MLKAISLVAIIGAVGKLLGFGREAIIAAYFGASQTADVFFVANMIPTLLYTAIGIAIYSGIIPIYMEEREGNPRNANRVISILGTLFIVIACLITALAIIFARPLVLMVAPGFSNEQLSLTVKLTQICLPSILFFTLTTIATGVLNANKKFIAPALTSATHNLLFIVVILFFANTYGAIGLAIGSLIGAAGQFIIQYPQLARYQLRLNFSFYKQKERIKNTLVLLSPIMISSLMVQLNGVVDRMISSGLAEGSVSALNYANKLMQLPLSIIVAPLITVLYPSIVEAALEGKEKFSSIVLKGARMLLFISIPFIVIMLVCSKDLIDIAFQRGAFDNLAANKTSEAFIFYTIGLLFFALRDFLMNCFFALKQSKTVMGSSVISVVLNIILSYALSQTYGAGGIAFATSIAAAVQACLLGYFLWDQTNRLNKKRKLSFVEGVKFIFIFSISYLLTSLISEFTGQINQYVSLFLLAIVAFFTLIATAFLLKLKELHEVLSWIKKGSRA